VLGEWQSTNVNHPEQPGRLRAIFKRVTNEGLLERCYIINPALVSEPPCVGQACATQLEHFHVRVVVSGPGSA
jgi:acetoin utilization deacetylase AcuC-like enzyme